MEESEILKKIIAGDTDQFGLLYDAYADRIYKYLFYRTHDQEVAQDLTSTTFFKAIQSVQKFDTTKGNFSSWIYRIARNTLFDHYRTKKQTDPIEYAETIANDSNIEEETMDRELVRKVKESFSQLNENQQEIITMRIWDELSYAEIAKILGKSEASCKVAFHRATLKLKEIAPIAIIFLMLFPSFNTFIH